MRQKNSYVMRRCDTPKRVTLPNGRTFFTHYKRVSRGHLPANIRLNRTYRNQVARGRRRGQRGHDWSKIVKKLSDKGKKKESEDKEGLL